MCTQSIGNKRNLSNSHFIIRSSQSVSQAGLSANVIASHVSESALTAVIKLGGIIIYRGVLIVAD